MDFICHNGEKGLVSVIIPVYNRGDFVSYAIESILNQSYRYVEIVAVNDGSTDNSLAVLSRYASQYPVKVFVVDQPNAGQVRARNVGIRRARGEYIAFLDSDDTWALEKLDLQVPLFREKVGLVYSGINEIDTEGEKIRTVPCERGMRGNIYKHLLVKNRMTGGSVVVRRTALDKVGLFDESFQAAENWDLWIRIAKEYEVDFVDRPLVNYRVHQGNMSIDCGRMAEASWKILQKHLPLREKSGPLRETYILAYANYYYENAVDKFSRGDYANARNLFLKCWVNKLFYKDSAARYIRSFLGKKFNMYLSNMKKRFRHKTILLTLFVSNLHIISLVITA
jgi:glycosyltransferase involved in cell wall biosynthesis